jgi:hypothetical protein
MKADTTIHPGIFVAESIKSPTFQAYQILHWGFVVAPILAGFDKFFNKMVDWSAYLWEPLGRMVGGADTCMRMIGAVEIVAGLLVAFKPKIGAPIVAAWLFGIIVNLLLVGRYFDIALRDLGLCLGALALSRLALQFDHKHTETT